MKVLSGLLERLSRATENTRGTERITDATFTFGDRFRFLGAWPRMRKVSPQPPLHSNHRVIK